MNKLLILLLSIIPLQFIFAQPQIVNCPLDTNSYFEITLGFRQFYDSTGKIKIQMDYGYAVPIFDESDSFKHKITNEECTPFNLEILGDVIYIYDSTGNWSLRSNNSNKFILNKGRVIHLKIYLTNTTTKTFNLDEIAVLYKLNLNIEQLEINGPWDASKSNIKLNVKHWPFKNIGRFYVYAPFKEKKTKLLRQLGKYKNLYKIEIHHQLGYY